MEWALLVSGRPEARWQVTPLVAALVRAVHFSRGALRESRCEVGGMSVGDEGLPCCGAERGPTTREPLLVTCETCRLLRDVEREAKSLLAPDTKQSASAETEEQ
jgi:hypothetical protein